MLQEFSHPPFTVIKCDNQTLLFVTLLDVEMDQDGDMICKSFQLMERNGTHTLCIMFDMLIINTLVWY